MSSQITHKLVYIFRRSWATFKAPVQLSYFMLKHKTERTMLRPRARKWLPLHCPRAACR